MVRLMQRIECREDAQSKIRQASLHRWHDKLGTGLDACPCARSKWNVARTHSQRFVRHHFIVGMTNSAPDLMLPVRPQQMECCEDAQSNIRQASLHCWHYKFGTGLDA